MARRHLADPVLIGIICLLAGLLLVLLVSSGEQEIPGPTDIRREQTFPAQVLQLGVNTVKVGTFIEGTKVRIPLQLDNPSTQSLTIDLLKSSCGCTAVQTTTPFTIEAGKRMGVEATLSTAGKDGKFDERIKAFTASGELAYEIHLVGFSTPRLRIGMNTVPVFLSADGAQTSEVRVAISCGPLPLEDLHVTAPEPWTRLVQCSCPKRLKAGQVGEISVQFRAFPVEPQKCIPLRALAGRDDLALFNVVAHSSAPLEVTPLSIMIDAASTTGTRTLLSISGAMLSDEVEVTALDKRIETAREPSDFTSGTQTWMVRPALRDFDDSQQPLTALLVKIPGRIPRAVPVFINARSLFGRGGGGT